MSDAATRKALKDILDQLGPSDTARALQLMAKLMDARDKRINDLENHIHEHEVKHLQTAYPIRR